MTSFTTKDCTVLHNDRCWITTTNSEDALKIAELFNVMAELTQALRWRAEAAENKLAHDDHANAVYVAYKRTQNKNKELVIKNKRFIAEINELRSRCGMAFPSPYSQ